MVYFISSLQKYMAQSLQIGPSPVLQLAARIPINEETQSLSRGGRNFHPPKWYQFKPRAILGTPWLEGLIKSEDIAERNRIILADEGGVGKTKASVIVVNHILSENPEKPILIVCPRRLIPDWKNEIKQVMNQVTDRIVGGDLSGAKTVLSNPLPGHIYVVSKHSLSLHFNHLKNSSWGDRVEMFSLVVIDEAHQGKADLKFDDLTNGQKKSSKIFEAEHAGNKAKKHSRLYASLKQVCNKFSERVLAVTASPLSLDLGELVSLAKMIGVKPEYYSKLENVEKAKENKFLEKWQNSTKPCRGLIKKQVVTAQDILDFKKQMLTSGILDLLPHQSEIKKIIISNDTEDWLSSENTRRNWLSELNPLATFVSATLRNDLGQESEELFRKRVTWTQFVSLEPSHLEALNREGENKSNLDPVSRYNQSWPTNHMGDSNSRCYDGGFDFEDNSNHAICPEPRINALVNDIFTKDLGITSNTKTKKGAVIFSNVIRTVNQISKWLNNRTITLKDDRKLKIFTHVITGGDVQFAINQLDMIDRDYSLNQNEYHVVVGTSAIQEGLSMNWATTVVHWDLVSNPQTLEQRTWRLDRHKKDDCNDSFNVVYIVTDTKSDKKIVSDIQARAELASTILGQGFDKDAWPQVFNQGEGLSARHIREYDDTMIQYFHPKAIDLASIWMGTGNLQTSQSEKMRKLQQESLFIGLSEACDWGLDVGKMRNTKEITCSNLTDAKTEQCRNLRSLMVIASNHDRATLQSLHPQSTWKLSPYLDWEKIKSSGSGRFFSASINPQGDFVSRILRRTKPSDIVVKGPVSNKKLLVFSVDCTNPIDDYQWELHKLYRLLDEKPSKLYSYEVSDKNLETVYFGNPIFVKMLEYSLKSSRVVSPVFDRNIILNELVENLVVSIDSSLDRLGDNLDDFDERRRNFKQIWEQNGEQGYLYGISRIDENIKEVDSRIESLDKWKRHLESNVEKNHYQINFRYVEGYK